MFGHSSELIVTIGTSLDCSVCSLITYIALMSATEHVRQAAAEPGPQSTTKHEFYHS